MCAIFGCKNRSRRTRELNIKYFSFPKDKLFCKKWIDACKRKDKINVKNARICSVHFTEDDFSIPLRQRLLNYRPKNSRNLRYDAVPTQKLPGIKVVTPKSNARERRLVQRNQSKTANPTKRPKPAVVDSEIVQEPCMGDFGGENRQLRARIAELEVENLALKSENSRLLEELKKQTGDRLERIFCLFATPRRWIVSEFWVNFSHLYKSNGL